MNRNKAVTKADLELIVRKLTPIKKAGHGKLLIRVADGNIVSGEDTVGWQVKKEIKE